jgi:hypothetical protein
VLGVLAVLVLGGLVAAVVVVSVRTARDGAPSAGGPLAPASSAAASGTATPSPVTSPEPTVSANPTRTPSPSDSPTAAPATPVPTAPTASTPAAPAGPNRSLTRNTLYGVDLGQATTSCDLKVRKPRPPLANKLLAPYLREVVSCVTDAFARPLAAQGFVLREPKVKTFHGSVKTPCGTFGQKGSPAYYCSATWTIYWPDTVDDGNEAYTFARLGYVGLVAHEFGHHVQASTGMLGEYATDYAHGSKTERYALSRRLELQAQCFEGIYLHLARKDLHVSATDRAQLRTWHSYTGDEDPPKSRKPDHGSSKEQYGWLERGMDSGDFGRCNTWTAKAKDVS